MSELKPCFCGHAMRWCGENEVDPEDNHDCHHIHCDKCGAHFSVESDADTLEEMRDMTAKAWNTRPDLKAELVEAMRILEFKYDISEGPVVKMSDAIQAINTIMGDTE